MLSSGASSPKASILMAKDSGFNCVTYTVGRVSTDSFSSAVSPSAVTVFIAPTPRTMMAIGKITLINFISVLPMTLDTLYLIFIV